MAYYIGHHLNSIATMDPKKRKALLSHIEKSAKNKDKRSEFDQSPEKVPTKTERSLEEQYKLYDR